MIVHKYILLVLAILTLGGCAFGQRIEYTTAISKLNYSSKQALAVAVHDQRPYILDHDKDEDFVGIQRGGYGNPFDVRTSSERPLAEDLSKVILKSINRANAQVVKTSPLQSKAQIVDDFKTSKADNLLLLSLFEWKTDTYNNTTLHYDIVMDAINKQGQILATKKLTGEDELGGSLMNPTGHARETVPAVLQKKLEDLYQGDIYNALHSAQ